MDKQPYLALIGDMVDSRQLPNRNERQAKVLGVVASLNELPGLGASVLAAPLTLTAGDEVQALIKSPEAAMTLIQELTDRCGGAGKFPVFVFGLGLGTLSTELSSDSPGNRPNPALADGPCFHLARQGLEAAKRNGAWVRCMGFEEKVGSGLNAIFGLMGAIRSTWTSKQRIHTYQVRRFRYQKEWAKEFGVSPSVVSESLQAAKYEEIREGEEAIRIQLRGTIPSE